MTDYMGLYDDLLNKVFQNNPAFMRKEAETKLFNLYDDIWRPQLQDIYPRTVAEFSPGQTATLNDQVQVEFGANPQVMARKADRMERTRPRDWGTDKYSMQAALFHEDGPQEDPFMFETELKSGYLARGNQMRAKMAVQALERRMEYELVHYTKGTPSVMDSYGNQRQKVYSRFKTFDAATDFATGAWSTTATSDPIDDIAMMNLYMNKFGEDIKMGFVGPNTAYNLSKNKIVRELLKTHYDLLANPIATTIQGVTLKKVMGQTYKDDSLNANRVGYPGFGDIRFSSHTTDRMIKMMVDAGQEWSIFVPGSIGSMNFVKTMKDHTSPQSPYVRSWEDKELGYVYSKLQIAMYPLVEDFAKIIKVTNMSAATV